MDEITTSELTIERLDLADKSLRVLGTRLKRRYENPEDTLLAGDFSDHLRRLDAAELMEKKPT